MSERCPACHMHSDTLENWERDRDLWRARAEAAEARVAELEAALREKADEWDARSRDEYKRMHSWSYDRGKMKTYEICADELRALLQEGRDE